MEEKRRIIVITDGDKKARLAVEAAGKQLNLRTISASAGNPTPIKGQDIVDMIKQAPKDPILVMVDDCGNPSFGEGEQVLQYLSNHPEIEVMGVVAVASDSPGVEGIRVDFSVDRDCNIIDGPVYKDGMPEPRGHHFIEGDTVDVLNQVHVPMVVGIGDIGKMDGRDSYTTGSCVTTMAIKEILNRSGVQ